MHRFKYNKTLDISFGFSRRLTEPWLMLSPSSWSPTSSIHRDRRSIVNYYIGTKSVNQNESDFYLLFWNRLFLCRHIWGRGRRWLSRTAEQSISTIKASSLQEAPTPPKLKKSPGNATPTAAILLLECIKQTTKSLFNKSLLTCDGFIVNY